LYEGRASIPLGTRLVILERSGIFLWGEIREEDEATEEVKLSSSSQNGTRQKKLGEL